MKVRVSELTGRVLNYAVAVCLWGEPENGPDCWREWKHQKENGLPFYVETSGKLDCLEFNPSGNWAHGGPLIGKFDVYLCPSLSGWLASIHAVHDEIADVDITMHGLTSLEAICSCVVRYCNHDKDEIEIPDELMEA